MFSHVFCSLAAVMKWATSQMEVREKIKRECLTEFILISAMELRAACQMSECPIWDRLMVELDCHAKRSANGQWQSVINDKARRIAATLPWHKDHRLQSRPKCCSRKRRGHCHLLPEIAIALAIEISISYRLHRSTSVPGSIAARPTQREAAASDGSRCGASRLDASL